MSVVSCSLLGHRFPISWIDKVARSVVLGSGYPGNQLKNQILIRLPSTAESGQWGGMSVAPGMDSGELPGCSLCSYASNPAAGSRLIHVAESEMPG